MKKALAQLASKVWEALKPPKPELGYFMPDEQSDAIRSWCSDVASSVLLDPNELDASDPSRERDAPRWRKASKSTTSASEREAAAQRASEEKAKAKAARKQ
ncbi:hypothetical protein CcaverHIS002_0502020 [Cutaneotrichosporon cavernicola]|uniref:Uncharacterized protein n=1 Tax=Cutaneotrichosporon cavernicola TaxID=279322 RepID=A0AA48L640_9TREE|nr:uncharacterized protein CcaverHIS019_0502610 [Cutaneotrichosporon cavernicola]BEI84801.1 hypothetical protein CcaverHIS002_0502020 [Cutaneotrichosporon cavernicola]BEI92633.1 hypothetical protein CcaverHIS019_0502610 [Cutaneotrichosporon cavernicola]BEJ00407.1 hypothetical protein CcaverHIS631_0502640 [Cutaneotrichosporon cavernicola]BEJ08177.1 hypothetical protein CcaverHIS641_0502620 [Cutaneotrichosporon cavernicola]